MRLRLTVLISIVSSAMYTTVAVAQDTVAHTLSVVLKPDQHHITVSDVIELPPVMRRAGLEFTLNAALTIHDSNASITKVASDTESKVRYAVGTLPADGILRVTYDGSLDYGLSDQKEEYTRGFRETLGTLGPEGIYLDGGSAWVANFGDGMISFTVDVQQPNDWHVISQGNGSSKDERGNARWDSAGLLEQVYLVGGPLVVAEDSAGAVDIVVYLHERDDALSRKYLDATARYLEMYRQLLGPYPYGKFALVENFWETGYGMPSFTLLGPQVIRFPFILHSSYPHEILHNWWGNSVFVDYESGNWCEGLTAYMADHLIQEQRGLAVNYRRSTLQKYRNYVREGSDFPLSEFRSRHSAATEAVGYGKSLMTFHMLRRHSGDDAFRAAFAHFYRKQRGQRASFADIRASFESVLEQNLEPFFTQWTTRVGAPALALNGISVLAADGGYVISGSLDQTQEVEPFMLEVPLRIRTEDGWQESVVSTNQRSHEFELRTSSKPLLITADAMFDVFRVLDPREIPASIGQIFGDPQVLAVLPAAASSDKIDQYRQLMEGWRTDDHNIELTLDSQLSALPNDRAVWLLGKENRFVNGLVAAHPNMTIDDTTSAVTLNGDEVPDADHCTVAIFRNPDNIDKAIGWITVEPAAAFAGMARKLPHYGKYSYLAFEGDEPTNTVKGQWDTTNSPLVVDLRKDTNERLPELAPDSRSALAELPPVFSRGAMTRHVDWLASPDRAGRGLGTDQLDESAQYIADAMAEAGLEPGGDNGSWFQNFAVPQGPDGRPVLAKNVIGVLPGSRADWASQSVVLSAHYDHLGTGWPDAHAGDVGKIHPGADDNASGVAVLLELARNLVSESRGSRSLVVIAFSAEESGRLGSQYYVKNPVLPISDVRGMVNLDTVGRLFDGQISVHGTGTADEWQHIFRGSGFVTGVSSRNVPGAAEGSDQASFISEGIPAVQIFTGANSDYHRPSDTSDKVDHAGLVKVATFVKEAVVYLLAREDPLTVRIESSSSTQSAPQPRGGTGRRVSFGTVPEFEFQGEGVKVASVVAESPADEAGILAGDILIEVDGQDLADLRAFSNVLKTLKPGQVITAVVMRDGKEVTVTVTVRQR